MSTFLKRALIIWYHSPVIIFLKSKYPSTQFTCCIVYWYIYYSFTTYSPVSKGVPVSIYSFFSIIQNLNLHFYISNELTTRREKYLCRHLSNRGLFLKEILSSIIYVILSKKIESIIQVSSFQHLAIKYYSFRYGQQNRPRSH